jgi:hypothetical protein
MKKCEASKTCCKRNTSFDLQNQYHCYTESTCQVQTLCLRSLELSLHFLIIHHYYSTVQSYPHWHFFLHYESLGVNSVILIISFVFHLVVTQANVMQKSKSTLFIHDAPELEPAPQHVSQFSEADLLEIRNYRNTNRWTYSVMFFAIILMLMQLVNLAANAYILASYRDREDNIMYVLGILGIVSSGLVFVVGTVGICSSSKTTPRRTQKILGLIYSVLLTGVGIFQFTLAVIPMFKVHETGSTHNFQYVVYSIAMISIMCFYIPMITCASLRFHFMRKEYILLPAQQ